MGCSAVRHLVGRALYYRRTMLAGVKRLCFSNINYFFHALVYSLWRSSIWIFVSSFFNIFIYCIFNLSHFAFHRLSRFTNFHSHVLGFIYFSRTCKLESDGWMMLNWSNQKEVLVICSISIIVYGLQQRFGLFVLISFYSDALEGAVCCNILFLLSQ